MSAPVRVWVDIESTGLEGSQLLELAVVVTSLGLDVLWQASALLPVDHLQAYEAAWKEGDRDPGYVQRMHTENGLWSDLYQNSQNNPVSTADIESALVEKLAEFGVGPRAKVPICGYNPGFDLSFLKADMPRLAACFSHQKIDVRSVELLVVGWGGEKYRPTDHPHRALADCLDEIEALRYYRQYIRV